MTSTFTHDDDDDDDLPVGADYRTVMAQAIASSEPSTSQGLQYLYAAPFISVIRK